MRQASISFCAVTSNLALDTRSASRNIISQFLFIEAKKKKAGRLLFLSYNQDRQNSLGTRPVYKHHLPPSRSPLSLENQKVFSRRYAKSLQRAGDHLSTYCSFGIAKTFFNKSNARFVFSISNFDVILSSAFLSLCIVPGMRRMPCMSTRAPNSKRPRAKNILTYRKEPSEQSLHCRWEW